MNSNCVKDSDCVKDYDNIDGTGFKFGSIDDANKWNNGYMVLLYPSMKYRQDIMTIGDYSQLYSLSGIR